MENITKGGGELLDRLGASIGYIQREDEELLKLCYEVDESEKAILYLKNEQKESEECIRGLKNNLESLKNFKKSLDSLGEERDYIYDLAEIYGSEGVKESKSCGELLDNYDFFEKMYSRCQELKIRTKADDFLRFCEEERKKLKNSREVLYRVKEDFLNEMSKINSVSKKKEKKEVENLMKYFQSSRFHRSTDTSGELVDRLLYGKSSVSD